MSTLRQGVQFFCGFAVFAAVFFSWLFVLTFWNRLAILREKGNYRPETFTVMDAAYERGFRDAPDAYWLIGRVADRTERLVPKPHGALIPRSADDLRQRYPQNTKLSVLYNPQATTMIVQGETLRVIEAGPDFWANEESLRWRLGCFVFVPVPLTLTIYLAVRFANSRQVKKRDIADTQSP